MSAATDRQYASQAVNTKIPDIYPACETYVVKYSVEQHPITGVNVWCDSAIYGDELCTVYPPHDGFNGCVTIEPWALVLDSTRKMVKRFLLLYLTPIQVNTAIWWCRLGRMYCFTKLRR